MSARYLKLLAAGLFCLPVIVAIKARGWMKSSPTVSGTVTVGGQLLDKGSISFLPIEGETPGGTAGRTIAGGKFEVSDGLTEGRYCITIQGTRPHPTRKIKAPLSDVEIPFPVQVVPEIYHGSESPLIRTVERGQQVFTFDLPEAAMNKRGT